MSKALALNEDGSLSWEKPKHKYGAKAMQLCVGCSKSWPANGTKVCCQNPTEGRFAVLRFSSTREMTRYVELVVGEKARVIADLQTQPRFKFPMGFSYVADFSYIQDGRRIVEDVKGMETAAFKLKRKCFEHFFPHLELRITK